VNAVDYVKKYGAAAAVVGALVVIVIAGKQFQNPTPDDAAPAPEPSTTAQPPAAVASETPVTANDASAPAQAAAPSDEPPPHNYSMVDGGEYGYQPGISEDEAKQGVVTKPLLMYRYRGVINDAYVVDLTGDRGQIYRMSCKDPCNFVKGQVIVGGQTIHTETLANTPGSVMYAVFEDALNGQLKPSNSPAPHPADSD
jgi:hypothetical protein